MKSPIKYLNLQDDLWYECLEDSLGFVRESWQSNWLGMPVLLNKCLKFLDLHEDNLSVAGKSMFAAARSVALEIENHARNLQNVTEPKFHNRLHFADVLTSMSIQLGILVELEKKTNQDWLICALLTSLAHDLAHPGKVNLVESEIEMHSVSVLEPILSVHAVPNEWQKVLNTAIIRSDFSIAHINHANVSGAYFEWDLKWLCVLLNEADVMASATSKYGPELGVALAHEWRLIDFPPHLTVSSVEGRNFFLRHLTFSSPASLVLGLNKRISEEIESNLA